MTGDGLLCFHLRFSKLYEEFTRLARDLAGSNYLKLNYISLRFLLRFNVM